jgi:hypothetical protein
MMVNNCQFFTLDSTKKLMPIVTSCGIETLFHDNYAKENEFNFITGKSGQA